MPHEDLKALERQLRREATSLSAGEDFDRLDAVLTELLSVREQIWGKDHWALAEARAWAITAKILRACAPDDRKAFHRSVDAVHAAHSLVRGREYARAQAILDPAIRQLERIFANGDNENLSHAWRLLAFVRLRLGDGASAESLARRALAAFQKSLGPDHPETGSAHNLLGVVLQDLGSSAEAEVHLRRGLSILEAASPTSSDELATRLFNLGIHLQGRGELQEAERLLRRSMAMRMQLAETGRASQQPRLRRAAARVGSQLAECLRRQGRFDDALQAASDALAVLDDPNDGTSTQAELSVEWALVATVLARVEGELGRLEEAEATLRRIVAVYRERFGEQHVSVASAERDLATLLLDLHRPDEAVALLNRAVAILSLWRGDAHPATVHGRLFLALAQGARGDAESAERELLAAAIGFEHARLLSSHSPIERARFAASRSPLGLLAVFQARRGETVAAWETLDAHLSRSLLEELSDNALGSEEQGLLRDLAAQIERLDEQLDAASRGGAQTENEQRFIEGLRRRRDAARTELVSKREQISRQQGVQFSTSWPTDRVRRALRPDEALIAWIDPPYGESVDPGRWAFVLRARGAPVCLKLAGSGDGGAWTHDDGTLPQRLRQSLSRLERRVELDSEGNGNGSSERTTHAELARSLARQRLEPLRPHLAASDDLPRVRRLIVVGPGPLVGVPIEVLTDDYEIVYAPSPTIFARLRETSDAARSAGDSARPRERPKLLVFGDPTIAVERGLPALPASRREALDVARIVRTAGGKAQVLVGDEATDTAIADLASTDELGSFDILHFATHCRVEPQSGLRSALVLAAGPGGDGLLSAGEMLRTWKLDADLVVLSACETGLGALEGGEGYVGLSHGLFGSGARSVLLSLWKVEDVATLLLMRRFYENLTLRGLSKSQSLREAKRWLRELDGRTAALEVHTTRSGSGREITDRVTGGRGGRDRTDSTLQRRVYSDPYYWAGFVLVGVPD